MTLEDAKHLLHVADKYGVTIPDTEGMTDNEIIKLAEWMQERGDYEANSREE